MNGARCCLTFCFVKSNISLTYAHISRRTFQETVFHFDPVLHGHFRVVSSGQKLQHRKKVMSNHHCESEMIVSQINSAFRLFVAGFVV